MLHYTNDNTVFQSRFNQWISSLHAYNEQLQNISAITKQLAGHYDHTDYFNEVRWLQNEIVLKQRVIESLTEEVMQLTEQQNFEPITVGFLLVNNKLREKIRKAEQDVFILKFKVNQLLSSPS
jgi:hypothetical protein